MATHKIKADLDVDGEVQGTSLDINGIANITSAAGTAHLLTLHNTTNAEGCSINFSDVTAGNQTGTIDFFHADSMSQGGGASFVISSSEADMVLNVGGRIVVAPHGSNAEVDYGFVDDIDTGMMRSSNHAIRFVTGGTAALDINASQNATFAGDITVGDDVFIADGGIINVGSGNDLNIQHDGSDSIINNNTGHLYFTNYANDKDIIFRSDDGSGGITEYFRLDGSEGYNIASKHIMLEDNVELRVGSGADLKLYHDGSNNYIQASGTGDIIIEQRNDDKDIVLQSDNGSGGVTDYIRLDGSSAKVLVSRPSIFYDTIEMASYIYHNGDTNSYFGFSAADTFNLHVGGAEVLRVNGGSTTDEAAVSILCGGGTNVENIALLLKGDTNGEALKLKIQNPNNGGTLTGAGILSYEPDDDTFNIGQSTTHNNMAISIDNSENITLAGTLTIPSDIIHGGDTNNKIAFSTDTQAFETGGSTRMNVTDSGFQIGASGARVTTIENSDSLGTSDTKLCTQGNVKAYVDTSISNLVDSSPAALNTLNELAAALGDDASFSTTVTNSIATKLPLAGGTITGNVKFNDSVELQVGSGSDLKLYHDGTDSYITNATNDLEIICTGDDIIMKAADDFLVQTQGSENAIYAQGNGKVELFHNNVSKFETTSNGVSVVGGVTISDDALIGNATNDDIITLESSGNVLFTYTAQFEDDADFNGKVDIDRRRFSITSGTDGNAIGDVVYFGSTTGMTIGKIYYYTSSGTWALADADSASTAKGMLGVALGTASNSHGVLLRGMVTIANDPGNVGEPVFLSTTAGAGQSSAPTGNGDIVRVIGYSLHATNGAMYFNPDGTFVEVSA